MMASLGRTLCKFRLKIFYEQNFYFGVSLSKFVASNVPFKCKKNLKMLPVDSQLNFKKSLAVFGNIFFRF